MNKEDILVEAVKVAKASEFGLTGIKVEFEAKFNRHLSPRAASHCAARIMCTSCGGGGGLETSPCGTCRGTGTLICPQCHGTGRILQEGETDWNDMRLIHDKVLAKVAKYGLAKRIPRNASESTRARADGYEWQPKAPLVWSHVYHDGTVDTEQTLTISVEGEGGEKNAVLLPKLNEAFYSLEDEIGQGIDLSNAGMHISLLNSPGAGYPSLIRRSDVVRFKNFRKSMILLMPALYFLASSDDKSRPLRYRAPGVTSIEKYKAIAYRNGALEFRVFETCHERPEAVLDDVMVALNCLRFWTKKYTRNYLQKVANDIEFGKDVGTRLDRFYVTNEHIDLLNRGLRMIKPSWYTVTELKKQRNFTTTKKDTRNQALKARIEAERQYKVYEERIGWEKVMRKNSYIANAIGDRVVYIDDYEQCEKLDMQEVEKEAEEVIEREVKCEEMDTWCSRQVRNIAKPGEYRLCVE